MRINLDFTKAYIIFFLFAVLRPTFYMISPVISRISDFLVIIFGVLLMVIYKKMPKLKSSLIWLGLFTFIMLLSLGYNSFHYSLSFADFIDLFRPIYFVVILFLSYKFITENISNNLSILLKLVIFTGLLNSILCLIQFIFHDYSFGKFIYLLYNVPNLYSHYRPGGLCYSHTEYSLVSGIATVILLAIWLNNKKNFKCLIAGLINIPLCFLSLSKAGIIFVLLAIAILVLVNIFTNTGIIKATKQIIVVSLFTLIPIFALSSVLINQFPYLYSGFSAMVDLKDTNNKSITPRLEDYAIVKQHIKLDDPAHLLIGYSPLRQYPEISYIEVSMLNIIFRFGILGFTIYYWFFINPLFISRLQRKNLLANSDTNVIYQALVAITASLIVVDFLATFSDTVKGQFIIISLLGLMLALKGGVVCHDK